MQCCNVDLCSVRTVSIIWNSGFATHYASWRVMQGSLGTTGFIIFVSILLFFPETSHPGARGIDDDYWGNTTQVHALGR